ncbi:MAG: Na-translocating system protein MpsB, partial [Planctomycetota bacterium]|nr:Na-translocating system protein MpsB [Planctomycetota bacterium]
MSSSPTAVALGGSVHNSSVSADPQAELRRQITELAELLPAQGPITAFVFLNTLQGLEDLPYDAAVALGSKLFGCEPYLSEDKYHEFMTRDRIRAEDLAEVIRDELGRDCDRKIGPSGTLFEMRLAMLRYRVRLGPPEELAWYIAETDALAKMRDDLPTGARTQFLMESREWIRHALAETRIPGVPGARGMLAEPYQSATTAAIEKWSDATWEKLSLEALWQVCIHGVQGVNGTGATAAAPVRPRDILRETAGHDADLLVHDVLVRLCAAFVDQGQAGWALPGKETGLFHSFLELYEEPGQIERPWMAGVAAELRLLKRDGVSPL